MTPALVERPSRRSFLAGRLAAAVALASHTGAALPRAEHAGCCPTRLTTLEAAPPPGGAAEMVDNAVTLGGRARGPISHRSFIQADCDVCQNRLVGRTSRLMSAGTAGNQQAMALARCAAVRHADSAADQLYSRGSNYPRVDLVQAGLLEPSADDGAPAGLGLAQAPPRIEPHINHLSDHDSVFSGDSLTAVLRTLRDLAPSYSIDPGSQTAAVAQRLQPSSIVRTPA